jgi:purine-cytosine permease-like protein
MSHFNGLFFTLGALFIRLVPAFASADPNATDISTFFGRLTTDLTVFALAMAGFFFALSALFYMASGATQNERTRQHAISSLYAALGGLALALLAGTIALLVNNAVTGASAGGPGN